MTKLKDILSPAFPTPRPRKPLVTVEYDSDFCLWVTDGSHQPDRKPILTEAQMHHAADQYRLGKSKSGKTNILLVRTGEAKRGVIGLFQRNLKNEQSRGLSVRFRGIDDKGVASYLLSLYCSAAILADDAIAVLEDVEVGEYYDYD